VTGPAKRLHPLAPGRPGVTSTVASMRSHPELVVNHGHIMRHRNEKEKEEDPHAADALSRPVLTALFGVLYTLAKENHSSSSVMALTSIFVDTLLVLVLFMTPEFPWAIKPTQWYMQLGQSYACAGLLIMYYVMMQDLEVLVVL
jgi:hypothetical protein